MAEWLKALVRKTSGGKNFRGFESLFLRIFLESWVSGLNHQFAKLATPVWGSESSNLSLSAVVDLIGLSLADNTRQNGGHDTVAMVGF